MAILKGIDISNNNWNFLSGRDFYDIKAADFVIMKASEGRTYKDPKLDEYYNILHGSADGRPDPERCYGFYHYARPENYNLPQDEAKNFLRLVSHHAGHALFALDVEGAALRMDPNYLNAWVSVWCKYVHDFTRVRPLIYCSRSDTARFSMAAADGCGLWCASWGSKKPGGEQIKPWDLMAIWQYSTDGGHIDRNRFYGSVEQWRAYCERR